MELDRIICADVLAGLSELPDGCVHTVVTSPPYWGLRDYGVPGQLGLEKSPEEYLARMVEVFREVRRVLRDDGTAWVNMGDSYTSGGRDSFGPGTNKGQPKNAPRAPQPLGLKPKDLCGIPWRLALALQADGWWLRMDVIEEVELYCPCGCGYKLEERIWRWSQDRDLIWKKANPMPESVTDRPTKSHEYIFLLSKQPRYFYDAEAVREPIESGPSDIKKMLESLPRIGGKNKDLVDPLAKASAATNIGQKRSVGDPSGRNKRSVWTVATAPFSGAHFATFPPKLIEPCILAGCPAQSCPVCGAPWVRVVDVEYKNPGNRTTNGPRSVDPEHRKDSPGFAVRLEKNVSTLGFRPTCDHGAESVPGVVLDPFLGAGTVAVVAIQNARRWMGIELNPAYVEMARRRIRDTQPGLAC
jgi:DNA modification methylase